MTARTFRRPIRGPGDGTRAGDTVPRAALAGTVVRVDRIGDRVRVQRVTVDQAGTVVRVVTVVEVGP